MKTCKSVSYGKLDAGNPHVRFDEGEATSANPRRGSLLYKTVAACFGGMSMMASAQTCTWVGHTDSGSYTNATVRWSDAARWSPCAPTATDTAYFPPNQYNSCFFVTPPADFTGKIATTNDTAYSISGVDIAFPTHIRVSPSLSSGWTVTGSGTLIITNGVTAANIDAEFCGTIMVPAGEQFTASADVPDAVTFTGDGELTITKAVQLDRIFSFHGTLVKSGDAATAVASELVSYQGRHVTLADGETLALTPNLLNLGATEKMKGALGGSYWSVNSNHAIEEYGHYYADSPAPSTLADGMFVMADCPGQRTTMWYKGRTLRIGDDWGMKFKLIITMPYPSQVTKKSLSQPNIGGSFGISMKDVDGDEIFPESTTYDGARYVGAPNCYGTGWYYWNNNFHMMWKWNTDSYRDGIWPEKLGLFSLNERTSPEETEPIDINVTCVRGIMSVTVGKSGNSFTYRKDFSKYMNARGTGFVVGIAAESFGSSFASGSTVWSLVGIRDFSGWIRSREATEAWQEQSDVATFNTDNYTNAFIQVADGNVVTNVNTAAYTESGAIRLMPTTDHYDKNILRYTRGGVCARYDFTASGCYLVSYDMTAGNKKYSDRWGGLIVGLPSGRDQDYIMSYTARYGITRTDFGASMEVWMYGPSFYHNFRGNADSGKIQFCNYSGTGTLARDVGHDFVKVGEGSVRDPENCKLHYDFFYDGMGYGLATDYRSEPVSGATGGRSYSVIDRYNKAYFQRFVEITSWGDKRNRSRMQPAVWAGCDNNVVDLVLNGITVKKLSDNVNAYVPSTFAVGASKSATLSLAPTHPDSTTPVATLRDVSLDSGAQLNVTTEKASAHLAVEGVSVGGVATLAAVGNTALTLGGKVVLDAADAKLVVTGDVSFDGTTLAVTIPQEVYTARQQVVVLDFTGATVAALPTAVRVLTDEGADVTARVRPTFEGGQLVLFKPLGISLWLR